MGAPSREVELAEAAFASASSSSSDHDLAQLLAPAADQHLHHRANSNERRSDLSADLDGEPKAPTPIPKMKVLVFACVVVGEGIALSLLLPFVSYLVISFGVPEKEVGYQAGLVTSAFFVAQLIASVPLGMVSDKFGRKPVLLAGLAANFIFLTMFGFSKGIVFACATRFLLGVSNVNNPLVKTYIREISDDSNQTRMFSIRSLCYSLGRALGPLIGGTLARPAVMFPNTFDADGFFGRWPYLLPCLVGASINVFGFITGLLFVEETLKRGPKEPAVGQTAAMEAGTKATSAVTPSSPPSSSSSSQFDPIAAGSINSGGDGGRAKGCRCCSGCGALSRETLILSGNYMLFAFFSLGFDEVFSIWALLDPADGGLGFQERHIGLSFMLGGVGMVVFQLLIFVRMDRRFGTLQTFRIVNLSAIPLAIALPFANLFARSESTVLLWIYVGTIIVLKFGIATSAFAAVNIAISNTAPVNHVALVNGFASSAAAGSRLISPAVMGSIFAFTLGSSWTFPFDFHFAFLVMAVVLVANVALTYTVPTAIANKRSGRRVAAR